MKIKQSGMIYYQIIFLPLSFNPNKSFDLTIEETKNRSSPILIEPNHKKTRKPITKQELRTMFDEINNWDGQF